MQTTLKPCLVAAPLRAAGQPWRRYCPIWFMTGSPATWTTSEPKLRRVEALRQGAKP